MKVPSFVCLRLFRFVFCFQERRSVVHVFSHVTSFKSSTVLKIIQPTDEHERSSQGKNRFRTTPRNRISKPQSRGYEEMPRARCLTSLVHATGHVTLVPRPTGGIRRRFAFSYRPSCMYDSIAMLINPTLEHIHFILHDVD